MDSTDRKILQNLLARRVGKAVYDSIKSEDFEESLSISVEVNTPTCYIDGNGEVRNERIITVFVDFLHSSENDEDSYD